MGSGCCLLVNGAGVVVSRRKLVSLLVFTHTRDSEIPGYPITYSETCPTLC